MGAFNLVEESLWGGHFFCFWNFDFFQMLLDASANCEHGFLHIHWTNLWVTMIQNIETRENLKSIWNIRKHIALMPRIDSPKIDNILIFLDDIFPKLIEISRVATRWVINLNHPYLCTLVNHIIIVLRSECHRGWFDLADNSAISIIVLPFLGITENLPCLHYPIKFFFAILAVWVSIGMVL